MITLLEINQAICRQVKAAFSEAGLDIPLNPEDLSEPIQRPSIKVMIEDGSAGQYNSCMKRTGITVRFYFFAKNAQRPKEEWLQVREALTVAFLEEVRAGDFWIPLKEDIEFTVSDGILVATMELEFLEELPSRPEGLWESEEMMERLHLAQRWEE